MRVSNLMSIKKLYKNKSRNARSVLLTSVINAHIYISALYNSLEILRKVFEVTDVLHHFLTLIFLDKLLSKQVICGE